MVTLKHLAEQLNVSVSTVSKALHNSDEISPDTIERVKALAEYLNYKPNRLAVSLKSSKTNTIGVIIPNILNHFFAKALYAIEMEASKQGYNIITCVTNESSKKEIDSLQLLSNGSVDGFIISLAEETQVNNQTNHISALKQQDIPIVLFDRISDNVDCNKVILDDFEAGYAATMHLLKEGRKHIVAITDIEELSVGKQRTNGYKKALEDFDGYNNEPQIWNVGKAESMESDITDWLKNSKHVDGIISVDNVSGLVALNQAKKLGIHVPKNISIIAFSDENVLPFSEPKLSTLSQHTTDHGKDSVELLISQLKNPQTDDFKTKIIQPHIILRETTL